MYKHIWTQRTVLSLEKQDGRELWRKPAKILQEPTSKQSANKAVLQHTNTNSTSTKWLAATKQECWKIGMAQKWLMSPCLEQLHKQKILYLPHPLQIKTCSPQKPAFPPLQLLNCHQELVPNIPASQNQPASTTTTSRFWSFGSTVWHWVCHTWRWLSVAKLWDAGCCG